MKAYIIFSFFILMTIAAQGQETSQNSQDFSGIQNTVEMYFEGWLTGDTTLLGKAMHSSCQLKYTPKGKFAVRKRNEYLSYFQPRPRLAHAGGQIKSVDITGNIASVKCELETEERLFTDYFNMMRIDDQWVILDKISTNSSKASKE